MYVYLRDRFVAKEEASVSIDDRGFKFGDGAFETIRIKNSVAYNFNFHLDRLKNALEALYINYDKFSLIKDLSYKIISLNKVKDGFLRIYITRGEGSFGYLPIDSLPNLYIECYNLDYGLYQHLDSLEAKLHISDWRSLSDRSLPRGYKLANAMNYILPKIEAKKNGCFESVIMNFDGSISDCSSSNIFISKNDKIFTPDLKSGAINGSIRNTILKILPEYFFLEEKKLFLDDLISADFVFITNVSLISLEISAIPALAVKYNKNVKYNQIKEILLRHIEQETLLEVVND